MSDSHTVSAGWLELSIRELVQCHKSLIVGFQYALVTYLDSSSEVFTLPAVQKVIGESGIAFEQYGSGLLVSGAALITLVETRGLFAGFDEVWFFRQYPGELKPREVVITAPLVISKELPSGLVEWMRRSGCVLGLGDGIGLNYITVDGLVADALSQLFEEPS
jgi:hypothetical protein